MLLLQILDILDVLDVLFTILVLDVSILYGDEHDVCCDWV